MKFIKRFFLALLVFIFIVIVGSVIWLKSTAPDYSGSLQIKGLHKPVNVVFDKFGVPHIQAEDNHDAYMALGYVIAQERLFQMEMVRRVAGGRLSEIIGKEMVPIDKKLRILDLYSMAKKAVSRNFKNKNANYVKETEAYLQGINYFIDNGTLPIEFMMMGFKPDHFTPEDVYAIIGYMSFTFTYGLTQDPFVTQIKDKLGDKYLKLFKLDSVSFSKHYSPEKELTSSILNGFNGYQDIIPVPVWEGSNNWVISKYLSKSHKPVLANDTHIKYSQPSVWYEAVLEYPDYSVSGYYLAGVPYAVVGNTKTYAWGVTIFPFDNMDIYREKSNPENNNEVWHKGAWEKMKTVKNIIKVKGADDVVFNMKYTGHGPVINEAFPEISKSEKDPLTLWWSMNKLDVSALNALYFINNTKNMDDFRKGVSLIDVLGLNVVYADAKDNIAWWAAGKLPERPPHVNPFLILDGASGKDEPLGYYPFELNPQSVNPEDGILETSNDQPPEVNGVIYPGYYSPGYRAARVKKLLNSKLKWSAEEMQKIQLDNVSDRDLKLTKFVLNTVNTESLSKKNKVFSMAVKALKNWNGSSDIENTGVTVYTKMLYYISKLAMADELGDSTFEKYCSSILIRSSFERLFTNKDCIWWDNINTPRKETRKEIFKQGLEKAIVSLQKQFGDDVSQWKWGKVHTLTHIHPIGRKKPFDKIFNVGPFPVGGTNEVVDKESFHYNDKGVYPVETGPALRMIIDMSNSLEKYTIIPTGESGNVMSPHYSDQAELFAKGKYRKLYMDVSKIKNGKVLKLVP